MPQDKKHGHECVCICVYMSQTLHKAKSQLLYFCPQNQNNLLSYCLWQELEKNTAMFLLLLPLCTVVQGNKLLNMLCSQLKGEKKKEHFFGGGRKDFFRAELKNNVFQFGDIFTSHFILYKTTEPQQTKQNHFWFDNLAEYYECHFEG